MILKTGEVKEKKDKRVIGAEAFLVACQVACQVRNVLVLWVVVEKRRKYTSVSYYTV